MLFKVQIINQRLIEEKKQYERNGTTRGAGTEEQQRKEE
jgi:hypothetical protein